LFPRSYAEEEFFHKFSRILEGLLNRGEVRCSAQEKARSGSPEAVWPNIVVLVAAPRNAESPGLISNRPAHPGLGKSRLFDLKEIKKGEGQ
jgi:hypothetical protein